MGQSLATGMDEFRDPRTAPRTDRPGTFDPLYGFPNVKITKKMKNSKKMQNFQGRKPREMKATWEEM